MTPQMTETNLVDLDINEISSQLKAFNTQPLITRKCVVALNSLMLLHTKEELKESHLNSFFTRILKSFQSKERYLKFMTHLVIQKIGKDCSDSFLSISSLLKDLTDKNYKESALKALFSVIPDQMLNDYKPVLMQGYVSRNEEVENISSCIYYSLLKKNMVNDWIVSPSSDKSLIKMALNFEIKKNDKNFLSSMLNNPLKDAKGVFVVKVGFFLYSKDKRKDEFIREALKLKFNQEMIFVEACKQLLNLEDEDILKFLTIALDSLKSLLKSKNTIIKFTSIKLLNQLAKKFPQHCEVLSEEVEELINDKNKNINIIATTTILLIGGEESASRLITKISNVFSTLSDSYKTFLVEAVTKLLKKFKSKKNEFVSFYKTALEEKSSFEFKVFLLKCIKEVMASNRESFLKLLSFYIEDSLNYKITILVLGILSEEIPMLLDEKISKNYLIDNFLIHIFNRLILENNHVRIAALECLTNISKYIDFIQTDVINLLNKYSKDDALKDISLFLLQTYEIKGEELSSTELKNLGIKREEVNKLIKECRIDLSERNSDL
ncbi:hypothetical protein H311_00367, partial [Anncaliia algerae PRA109]